MMTTKDQRNYEDPSSSTSSSSSDSSTPFDHHVAPRPILSSTLSSSLSPTTTNPPPPPPPTSHRYRSSSTRRNHHHHSNPPSSFKPTNPIESWLIILPLLLTIYRLHQIELNPPPPLTPFDRQIPIWPSISIPIIILIISSIRSYSQHHSPPFIHPSNTNNHSNNFKLTFTDSRGYRDPHLADDGLSLAIGLPFLVSAAVFINTFHPSSNLQAYHHHPTPTIHTTTHLMDLWNQSPQLSNSTHKLNFTHSDHLLSLSSARLDLLAFTILNLYSLLIDLLLSSLAELCGYLPPISNSTRLIASTLKSLSISILFSLALRFGWWGPSIGQSMTSFECLFSVFAFQSCLYLTTRLARRAFTLAESSIFSSTSVALMIEVIRLTSARLRYSAYLKKQAKDPRPIDARDRLSFLPALFRFPTPAIAIQHVLVSGVFLMAFTLAPLLVLSRRLGQRPTKPHRLPTPRPHPPPTISSFPQIQKPIWTSEPTQPDYYRRFSNPDVPNQSRQYQSALKDHLRKIVALSIYASISWIGLVVMSHWLGWLFEIGRHHQVDQSWIKRILGPGWMAFFYYCFFNHTNSHKLNHLEIDLAASIRWTRIGMLIYWWVCLVIGIGGWTTWLVRKRRPGRRGLLNGPHDLRRTSRQTTTNWSSRILDRYSLRSRSRSRSDDNRRATTTAISTHHSTGSMINDRFKYNVDPLVESNRNHHLSSNSPSPTPIITVHPQTDESHQSRETSVRGDPPVDASGGSGQAGWKIRRLIRKVFAIPSTSEVIGAAPEKRLTSSTRKAELNLKRKFFHLLACWMFLPTIPLDIEFSSISFSVAFVIFTFSEFARYFAFYPIGAGIHLFFNEFIDSKDSGPVILSHFYLLTACSTGIWLDGLTYLPSFRFKPSSSTSSSSSNMSDTSNINPSSSPWKIMSLILEKPLRYIMNDLIGGFEIDRPGVVDPHHPFLTGGDYGNQRHLKIPARHHPFPNAHCKIEDLIGVIILGIGDTCASIVGKRIGKLCWNGQSSKTVEGSIAFVVSVILISLSFRVTGLVESFPIMNYSIGIFLVGLMEGLTNQNDNLILPLYSWSILKLIL